MTTNTVILSAVGQLDGVNQAIMWTQSPSHVTSATAAFTTYGLTDGLHTASITFIDLAGRTSSRTWSFTVLAPPDTTPPTTTAYQVSAGQVSTGTVHVQLVAGEWTRPTT